MKTLSHEHLHCREFGSALLDVGHLVEWLATKRLRCPIALPAAYVQVEWMLAAIQRDMQDSMTDGEAREIVMASAQLREHRCAESNPAWLLGGEAYRQWAALARDGVERGELVLLDFSSKLPIPQERAGLASDDDGPLEEGKGHEWLTRARAMAAVMIERSMAAGVTPKKLSVAREIADLFVSDGTLTKNGKAIDAEYVQRHALQGWGDMIAEQEKKKIAA